MADVPPPNNDPARSGPCPDGGEEAVAVVGVYRYNGIVAVTYYRLTLHLDGAMELHNWRDIGGVWVLRCRGGFSVDGAQVTLAAEWPLRARHTTYPEDLSRPFHARFVKDALLLVSDRNVHKFDQRAGRGGITAFGRAYPFASGWEVFRKEETPTGLVCVGNGAYEEYEHALTVGKPYLALEERVDAGMAQVRVVGDHGRTRWFPAACFRHPHAPRIPALVPTDEDAD
jgi:hypothetical protein